MKPDTTKTKPKKQPKLSDDGRSHAPDCSVKIVPLNDVPKYLADWKGGDPNRFEVHLPKGKRILNHGHTGIDLDDGRSFDLWTSLYEIKGDTAIWSITILGVSQNAGHLARKPAPQDSDT